MSLTFDDARHFLSRTGFGASPEEIRRLMSLDRRAAVEQALGMKSHETQVPPPSWVQQLPPLPRERKQWNEYERKAFREARKEEGLELKRWWYRVLLTTREPTV